MSYFKVNEINLCKTKVHILSQTLLIYSLAINKNSIQVIVNFIRVE